MKDQATAMAASRAAVLAAALACACGASTPRGANEDASTHYKQTPVPFDGAQPDAASAYESDCMPARIPRNSTVKGPRETIRCKGGGALRLAIDHHDSATGYYVPRDVDDAVDEVLAAAAPASPESASNLVTKCYRELTDAWGLVAAGRFANYGYSNNIGGLDLLYLVHRCTADRSNSNQACDLCKHLRRRRFDHSWPDGLPTLTSSTESSFDRGGL